MAFKRKRSFRKRYGRKPYSRRKLSRKMVRVPRQLKSDFLLSKFKSTIAVNDVLKLTSGSTFQPKNLVFSLDQANGAAGILRHFERYKICKVVVKFIPRKATLVNIEASDGATSTVQEVPDMYYLVDYNDEEIPQTSTEQWFRGNSKVVSKKATRPHTITMKPRCLQPFYSYFDPNQPEGINWSFRSISPQWVEENQANESTRTQYFGMKFGMSPGQVNTYTMDLDITYYIAFAGRKPL